MYEMNREQMIDWLVQNDIETWTNEYADLLLRDGFIGYNNQTDADLHAEIVARGYRV